MKKTFTFLFAAVMMLLLGVSSAFAQPGTFYKKHHLSQSATGVGGWTVHTANNSSSFHYRNGGAVLNRDAIRLSGGGGNGRGGAFTFPATNSTTDADFTAATQWNIEFNITMTTVETTYRNAFSFVFGGSNDIVTTNASTYYLDGIFGFFVYGGTNIHYMNMDNVGVPISDANGELTGENGAPALRPDDSGNGFVRFTRAGTSLDATDALCLSTKTDVTFTKGVTYHIAASLDFATQKVVSLTITEVDNPSNTATILDKPFLAPTFAGVSCDKDVADRIVADLSRFHFANTRASNVGNGNNTNIDVDIDNLEVYIMKESVGKADVTINYVDRDGNVVKPARVAAQQEVTLIYNLLDSDKVSSFDGTSYLAFDETATHAANAAKGLGENLTVGFAGEADNSLTVVFKKSPLASGTYVWGGNNGFVWDYLQENFSVSGGAPISYQPGNAAQFSADVSNKEVQVVGAIELADANITVSAPGYAFTGTGSIESNGSMIIQAPVTLGVANNMVEGAVIETSGDVVINNSSAATKITTAQPNITLNMESGFGREITSSTGGTLNLNSIEDNINVSSAIEGFSTVNIGIKHRGLETGNAWTNPITSTFTAGTTVNVTDGIDHEDIKYPATYAVNANSLADAKVNLGENTRIILNTTPTANNTVTLNIGELRGEIGSSIQGNCVGGDESRVLIYSIGALGTDAVFNGDITPQLTRRPDRRTGTEPVWERGTIAGVDTIWYTPTAFRLVKVGTGKWTVGGKIIMPDANTTPTFTVNDGTLELLDSLIAPAVNQITLTVDSAGTLKTHGNFIAAYNVNIDGTMEGGAEFGGTFNMVSENAVLKLKVNSFTEGNFEKIKTAGDIAITAGVLDFTVVNPSVGEIIVLETASNNNIDESMENITVLVNGVDITANTPEDNGYYFDPASGSLGYSGPLGLDKNFANKEIRSIEYFNVLGQKVSEHTTGVVLEKTTYTDDSVNTVKTFKKAK